MTLDRISCIYIQNIQPSGFLVISKCMTLNDPKWLFRANFWLEFMWEVFLCIQIFILTYMHIVAINSASTTLHVANLELLSSDRSASTGCVVCTY